MRTLLAGGTSGAFRPCLAPEVPGDAAIMRVRSWLAVPLLLVAAVAPERPSPADGSSANWPACAADSGLTNEWTLTGATLDSTSSGAPSTNQGLQLTGQVLADQVTLTGRVRIDFSGSTGVNPVAGGYVELHYPNSGNVSDTFPRSGEHTGINAGEVREWTFSYTTKVPVGMDVYGTVSVGYGSSPENVICKYVFALRPFAGTGSATTVAGGGGGTRGSASDWVRWVAVAGGIAAVVAVARMLARSRAARGNPAGADYILQAEPPIVEVEQGRPAMLYVNVFRVGPGGALGPAPEATVTLTPPSLPAVRATRAGTNDRATYLVEADQARPGNEVLTATATGPAGGATATVELRVKGGPLQIVIRPKGTRQRWGVTMAADELLADGVDELALVAHVARVGDDRPQPDAAITEVRVLGLTGSRATEVNTTLVEHEPQRDMVTIRVWGDAVRLDTLERHGTVVDVEVRARRRVPSGLGDELPPARFTVKVRHPNIAMFAIPGRHIGTVEVGAVAYVGSSWDRALQGLPMECAAEPVSAPGAGVLRVDGARQQTTDGHGVATWQMAWSGVTTWDHLPQVLLSCRPTPAAHAVDIGEHATTLIDVDRNARELAAAVDADKRDPMLKLVNPRWTTGGRMTNLNEWVTHEGMGCAMISQRVIEWLLQRRAGIVDGSFDQARAASMIGLEPAYVSFATMSMAAPQHQAAGVVLPTTGQSDAAHHRFLDSWHDQTWPPPWKPDAAHHVRHWITVAEEHERLELVASERRHDMVVGPNGLVLNWPSDWMARTELARKQSSQSGPPSMTGVRRRP